MELWRKNGRDGYFMAQHFFRKAHEVETWISAFQPDNSNVLLTGADDSLIKVFDRRLGTEPLHALKSHSSGVTALQFHENNPHVLFTGSFDRRIMRFDMRNLKSPISAWPIDGAVWYIDFVDSNNLHIAGCYDGALVYVSEDAGEEQPLLPTSCEMKRRFAPDNALIYGATHYELPSGIVYASCNFYEKQILFWQ
ncbi:WD repeat-containing 85, putative [Babesia ovata]|uniref:methylated diphthine methylhydrolase n=1 Tax=Babesia ovata TaxID=189622 RepID=A0A2H6KCX3_9APIC|nr:WD repeat-containing 85, putative [Babesia ovata]GBE60842.1 WD repeat-containing 85, putative [Babesia ovata]